MAEAVLTTSSKLSRPQADIDRRRRIIALPEMIERRLAVSAQPDKLAGLDIEF